MKWLIITATIVIIAIIYWLTQTKNDRVIGIEENDIEMNDAIAQAKVGVEDFIKIISAGDIETYSVKAPVKDGEAIEHFWLKEVRYSNGMFTGKIDNDPGIVTTVKLGQEIKVSRDEITDWLYIRGGKMEGNYTLRVLIKRMPPDDAAQIKKQLGWD
jgi:uncharacterized protein YegJ (DUF2314 family)